MVQVSELHKYYGGKRALGPVSFEIARGETVGFLGLNGVGKTTLLRILAGVLRPSAGTVRVDGVDGVRDPHAVRGRVGFLPEIPPLYPEMTVHSFLRFAGRLRGLEATELEGRVREAEAATHLEAVVDERVAHLSQGYRQRVGVAQAIVHDPALLILDEPTRDLDPVQIVEMRRMIRNLQGERTILMSSHILPEISETCDRLLVLNAGVVLFKGSEAELGRRLARDLRTEVTVRPAGGVDAGAVLATIAAVEGVRRVQSVDAGPEDGVVSFEVEAAADRRAEVCRALVEAGHGVLRLTRARRELEDVFLRLVGGAELEGAGGNGAGSDARR